MLFFIWGKRLNGVTDLLFPPLHKYMFKKWTFMLHKIELTPHIHTNRPTHRSCLLTHVHMYTCCTWTHSHKHTHTHLNYRFTDSECTWTTTQTLLHTMVTIYIRGPQWPTSIQPCPCHHGNKFQPPPTPSMAGSKDQWISQLAILDIPPKDFSFAWDCTECSSNPTSHTEWTLICCLLLCGYIKPYRH